jgi:hypothetical protein
VLREASRPTELLDRQPRAGGVCHRLGPRDRVLAFDFVPHVEIGVGEYVEVRGVGGGVGGQSGGAGFGLLNGVPVGDEPQQPESGVGPAGSGGGPCPVDQPGPAARDQDVVGRRPVPSISSRLWTKPYCIVGLGQKTSGAGSSSILPSRALESTSGYRSSRLAVGPTRATWGVHHRQPGRRRRDADGRRGGRDDRQAPGNKGRSDDLRPSKAKPPSSSPRYSMRQSRISSSVSSPGPAQAAMWPSGPRHRHGLSCDQRCL